MFKIKSINPLDELKNFRIFNSIEEALGNKFNLEEIFHCQNIKKKLKSSESLIVEFNQEKWGELKKKLLKNENFEIKNLENIEDGKNYKHLFIRNKHYLVRPDYFRDFLKYTNLKNINDSYSKKQFNSIVEIGCGYGSKLLDIPRSIPKLNKLKLLGLDISENGLLIAEHFANKYKYNLSTVKFDFRSQKINNLDLGLDQSLILSNFALHYYKNFSIRNIEDFINSGINSGIHFEPCTKLISRLKDQYYGKLCKNYIYLNDYTKSISHAFIEAARKNIINLNIDERIIGPGLLPGSLITWQKYEN